jgi:type IV secretory pathway TrbL component
MEHIIAGRFETRGIADTVAAVLAQYVDKADICIFHNNPPGQHDAFPVGGDEDEDPGAVGAENSAAGTAVAAGLAAGAVGALGGPAVAIAAAAVGAYSGSLVGAMSGLGGHEGEPGVAGRRHGGVMVSVRIAAPAGEQRVIDTLRREGAADIERAEGEWREGDWTDFDPVAAPDLVDPAEV